MTIETDLSLLQRQNKSVWPDGTRPGSASDDKDKPAQPAPVSPDREETGKKSSDEKPQPKEDSFELDDTLLDE